MAPTEAEMNDTRNDNRNGYDVGAIMGGLYGDGIIACRGAFSAGWVAQLKEDIETLFAEARAQRKLAQMGDISARSALTIHRGTANRSDKSRPVFVLGVDAPDGTNADKHDLQVTRAYWDSLPDDVRRHLSCRVVDRLETIVQGHAIEGLLTGAPGPPMGG
jgi:hypothetical protein